jgi:hypothetical protein
MLYIDPKEVDIIPAGRTLCADCQDRKASWGMKRVDGEAQEPLCGWCVMYGSSEWGKLNADELVAVGEYVKASALNAQGKNTVVPELDVEHRLAPDAADRFVMGVVFTSRLLDKGPLGRMTKTVARAQELVDDD